MNTAPMIFYLDIMHYIYDVCLVKL